MTDAEILFSFFLLILILHFFHSLYLINLKDGKLEAKDLRISKQEATIKSLLTICGCKEEKYLLMKKIADKAIERSTL